MHFLISEHKELEQEMTRLRKQIKEIKKRLVDIVISDQDFVVNDKELDFNSLRTILEEIQKENGTNNGNIESGA